MQRSRVRGLQEARYSFQNDDCKKIGHLWLHLPANFLEKFWTPGLYDCRQTKDFTVSTSTFELPLFSSHWEPLLQGSFPDKLEGKVPCPMALHKFEVDSEPRRYVQFVADKYVGPSPHACAVLNYIGFEWFRFISSGHCSNWWKVRWNKKNIFEPAFSISLILCTVVSC